MTKQKLVELIVKNGVVCVEHNGQPAQDYKLMTGIVRLRHFGRPYEEIKRSAPQGANAFIGHDSVNITGGLTAGIQEYLTHVVYLHIDDKQIKAIPESVDQPRRDPPDHSYEQSDAD